MTVTGSVEDRLSIRELLECYADAVFRHDSQAWSACWDDDGVWEIAGARLTGREDIVAAWTAAMRPFALAAFHVQPGAIEVTGDRAQVRSYTREFFVLTDGGRRHISGRYDDELLRTQAGWRFAVRRYALLDDHVMPTPG